MAKRAGQVAAQNANPMEDFPARVLVTWVWMVGLLLAAAGVIGFVISAFMDTANHETLSSGYTFSTGVYNIGLIENRRFASEVSGVLVVAGSVLFGCAFLAVAMLTRASEHAQMESRNPRGTANVAGGAD